MATPTVMPKSGTMSFAQMAAQPTGPCGICGKQMRKYPADTSTEHLDNDCGGDCWECVRSVEQSMQTTSATASNDIVDSATLLSEADSLCKSDLVHNSEPLDACDADAPVDAPWPRTPRPYQQDTIDFMLSKSIGPHRADVFGCIVTHAPGLGKTLASSIAAVEARRRVLDPTSPHYNEGLAAINGSTRLCIMVICPPHLMRMWFDHFDKQHPELSLALCNSGTKRERLAVLQPGYDVYIINYQAFRSAEYLDAVLKLPIVVVIADESHNIKSDKAEQSKAVFKITQLPTVKYRWLVTATPIKKEADDLYWQFHCVDPDTYHSKARFLSWYCSADYTRYGVRNVKLDSRYAREFNYIVPRLACDKDANARWTEAKRVYDWDQRKYVDVPAKPGCTCCPPYQVNVTVDRVQLPTPPAPETQLLKINLADWLNDIPSLENLESVSQIKRRKPITIKSTYTPPEPQYITTEHINPSAMMMGYSYKDVGMYLPPVISPQILVQMSTEARKMYEQMKATYRTTINTDTIEMTSAIAVLHSLRVMTCCDAKLDALSELIDSAPDGETHVVFCAYDMTAEEVARHLQGVKDKSTKPEYIAGHIKPTERNNTAARLARAGIPIVATLQSMSEGVDISYARYVHFFECDFTPGVMYQALSRVQRVQQAAKDDASLPQSKIETIVANYLMCENTVDVHVYNIARDRTKNARDILRVELAQ